MRSAKHVSINELKKQPRLGMANEFDKFAKSIGDLNKGGTVAKIAKEIDTFAASLKGVGPAIEDVSALVSANISEFAAMSAGESIRLAEYPVTPLRPNCCGGTVPGAMVGRGP